MDRTICDDEQTDQTLLFSNSVAMSRVAFQKQSGSTNKKTWQTKLHVWTACCEAKADTRRAWRRCTRLTFSRSIMELLFVISSKRWQYPEQLKGFSLENWFRQSQPTAFNLKLESFRWLFHRPNFLSCFLKVLLVSKSFGWHCFFSKCYVKYDSV